MHNTNISKSEKFYQYLSKVVPLFPDKKVSILAPHAFFSHLHLSESLPEKKWFAVCEGLPFDLQATQYPKTAQMTIEMFKTILSKSCEAFTFALEGNGMYWVEGVYMKRYFLPDGS